MPKNFDLGVMFRCQNAPEALVQYVQQAEGAGFDEVWIVEDCFFAGGIASVATALATTRTIQVGLGIMPATVRNPAIVAMEIAALSRLFPARFLPGFGHGVGEWMKQIGAFPASQLAALEEVTSTVRALLSGQQVDFQGSHVHLSQVQLEFPPEKPPLIALGVRGQKSLKLSGRVADGTLLAEFASADYVAWAIEQIKAGQHETGRQAEPHRVTVYTFCVMDEERENAIRKVRPILARGMASGNISAYLDPLGLSSEVQQLIAEKDAAKLERALPEALLSQLAVVGTPTECRAAILKLVEAGADSVVLVPLEQDFQMLETFSTSLLPYFT